MRAIYQNEDETVAVLIPTLETIDALISAGAETEAEAMHIIALKDTPAPYLIWDIPTGVMAIDDDTGEEYEIMDSREYITPFWVVEDADIPSDRIFRNAWEVDETLLGTPHGTGHASNSFEGVLA